MDKSLRTSYGLLEGKFSLIINIIMSFVKLSCGIMIDSISLTADGLHSLSNLQSSVTVIWGFLIADAPPDEKHPYGYGRMEQITTLIVAIIL